MNKILLGIIGAVILIGLYLMSAYNGLVTSKESVDNQWAQVETQYQRRFDLIPNLVETAKGVFTQEQEVFGQIANARSRYAGATTTPEKVEAANQVESALGRLLVITENYPQLRSTETMQTLMAQLEGTENRISVERGRYNDTVRTYNVNVKQFPNSLLAGMFGFQDQVYFQSEESAAQAPKVDFNQ